LLGSDARMDIILEIKVDCLYIVSIGLKMQGVISDFQPFLNID
jgi:hypothetical protein